MQQGPTPRARVSPCSDASLRTQIRVEGLTGLFAPKSFKTKESLAWDLLPLNTWWARQSRYEREARYKVSLHL